MFTSTRLYFAILAALIISLSLLIVSPSTHAAIPEEISYQAKLNDSKGKALKGPVTLTFTLYTDGIGNNPTGWVEIHPNVTLTDGVFDIALGSIALFSSIADIFMQPLFLGIQVDTDAEMTPLQPLLSVPYAFRAQSVDDLAIDAMALATDSVETDKIVDGAVTAAKINPIGLDSDSVDGIEGADIVTQSSGGVINNADLEVAGTGRILATGQGVEFADGTVQTTAAVATGSSLAINVNCPGDSIQSAIDGAPTGGTLILNITGSCNENVLIKRSNTTLQGGGSIDGIASGGSAVLVQGAQNVSINSLTLSTSQTNGTGLEATANADVSVDSVTIQNTAYGIWVYNEAFVHITNSNITGNTEYGILGTDGGAMRLENTDVLENLTDNGDRAAIGWFRAGNLRIRGNNTISNSANGGYSLWVYYGGVVRQDGGHTNFTGIVEFSDLVYMALRDATIDGHLRGFKKSILDLQDSTLGNPTPTVTGNFELSSVDAQTRQVKVVGPVTMNDGANLIIGNNAEFEGDMSLNSSTLSTGNNVTIRGDIGGFERSEFRLSESTVLEGPGGGRGTIELNDNTFLFLRANFDGDIISHSSKINIGDTAVVSGFINASLGAEIYIGSDASLLGTGNGNLFNNPADFVIVDGSTLSIDGVTSGEIYTNRSVLHVQSGGLFTGDVNLDGSRLYVDDNARLTGNVNANNGSFTQIESLGILEGDGSPGEAFISSSELVLRSNYIGQISAVNGSNVNVHSTNALPAPIITGRVDIFNHSTMHLDGEIFGETNLSQSTVNAQQGSIFHGTIFVNRHSYLNLNQGTSILSFGGDPGRLSVDESTVYTQGNPAVAVSGDINISRGSTFQLANGATLNKFTGRISMSTNSRMYIDPGATINIGNNIYFELNSYLRLGDGSAIERASDSAQAIRFSDFSTLQISDNSRITGSIAMGNSANFKSSNNTGGPRSVIDGDIIMEEGLSNSISIHGNDSMEIHSGHNIICNVSGGLIKGQAPIFVGGGSIGNNCTNQTPIVN